MCDCDPLNAHWAGFEPKKTTAFQRHFQTLVVSL